MPNPTNFIITAFIGLNGHWSVVEEFGPEHPEREWLNEALEHLHQEDSSVCMMGIAPNCFYLIECEVKEEETHPECLDVDHYIDFKNFTLITDLSEVFDSEHVYSKI